MMPEEVCWMYGHQVPVHMGMRDMGAWGQVQKGMYGHALVKYDVAYMYPHHTFVTQPTMKTCCLLSPIPNPSHTVKIQQYNVWVWRNAHICEWSLLWK